MPQPLSRVKPGATVRQRPSVLSHLPPNYAQLVAAIFSHSSLVEYRLGALLVRILGADAAPAIAMFATLEAQHQQLRALEAAAKAGLTEHEFDVFKATMSVTKSVQTPRNQLAHWIWAHSPELPDALLLAEPKSAKDRDREFTLALESGETDPAKIAALNTFDPANVQVYREGDLERARDDLAEATQITFLTVVYLDGTFRGRIKPLPWASRTATRDCSTNYAVNGYFGKLGTVYKRIGKRRVYRPPDGGGQFSMGRYERFGRASPGMIQGSTRTRFRHALCQGYVQFERPA
ncbi:hypothetical protein AB8Z38_27775 [Bradyrhizobium sp. LLZ17]|uniref:Uncharacterized protein n=1 Tax=Bradyrhizobium sp. LLZ17 TaxID=3239388 RepID=A0AB39XI25_9BRAD